ncbi:MAG: antibiotic biosynthesis monooxygenase [Rhizobiaceae bacterium]|nr:antibiotic biosynthesis monooxygenase [Rhizobiaceae bacterium]
MGSSMKTVALFLAKEGHETELDTLLRGMIAPSRAEPGNLRYDLWREAAAPGHFVLDELYVDEDAVAFHRASAHFKHYLARIGDIASRTAILAKPLDVVTPDK